jgi:transcriptional regulator of heat shock response
MLTKQEVCDRIEKIKMEIEQTKATYAKLEGHLSEALFWISEFDRKSNESVVSGSENLAETNLVESEDGDIDNQTEE